MILTNLSTRGVTMPDLVSFIFLLLVVMLGVLYNRVIGHRFSIKADSPLQAYLDKGVATRASWLSEFPRRVLVTSAWEELVFRYPLLFFLDGSIWLPLLLLVWSTVIFGLGHFLNSYPVNAADIRKKLEGEFSPAQLSALTVKEAMLEYRKLLRKTGEFETVQGKSKRWRIVQVLGPAMFGLIAGVGVIYYKTVMVGYLMHAIFYVLRQIGVIAKSRSLLSSKKD